MSDQEDTEDSLEPGITFAPQPGPQQQFLSSPADIAIIGGAAGVGKTFAELMEGLRFINRPGFGAVFFRRTYKQIMNQGGLWDTSYLIYPHFAGKPTENDYTWSFPQAHTSIQMAHLQYESSVQNWPGAQIGLGVWDELQQFTEYQFFYLLSRMRSMSGIRPYVRGSCNPDPDSWLATFISWWINQDTGYPILERSGKLRWFVRVNDELHWGSSRKELESYHDEEGRPIPPKSVTFIPGTVYDNQILLKQDPSYTGNLHALPEIEKMRLLKGNWKVRYGGGKIFDRAWFKIVDFVPAGGRAVTRWDFAATEISEESPDPDFTADVLMVEYLRAYFIIDFQQVQKDPADTDEHIISTTRRHALWMMREGREYMARWEQEPASTAKRDTWRLVRELSGIDAAGIPSRGKKQVRWKPFAAQAKVGNIYLLRGPWNTLLLNHLHNQPHIAHDDGADAASGAYDDLIAAGLVQVPTSSSQGPGSRSSSPHRRGR